MSPAIKDLMLENSIESIENLEYDSLPRYLNYGLGNRS